MFAFENNETVKKIVAYLPAVGVGATYGIPRTRYVAHLIPTCLVIPVMLPTTVLFCTVLTCAIFCTVRYSAVLH